MKGRFIYPPPFPFSPLQLGDGGENHGHLPSHTPTIRTHQIQGKDGRTTGLQEGEMQERTTTDYITISPCYLTLSHPSLISSLCASSPNPTLKLSAHPSQGISTPHFRICTLIPPSNFIQESPIQMKVKGKRNAMTVYQPTPHTNTFDTKENPQ